MDKKQNDPLRELIADDAAEVNRGQLAAFLKSFVVFGVDGSMTFRSEFSALDNKRKIEVILLGAKAAALLFPDRTDGLRAAEIIELDVLPTGSVKSTLKNLFDNRKIRKDRAGRYIYPGYRLNELS